MGTFGELKNKKRKASYTDIAYEAIKQLIYEEEIKQGELISENQLSVYLNISRTPVREAVRRLEAEGVLEAKQGLGTFLRTLTPKDIKDIYEVREAMELLAAKTAVEHFSREEIQDIREDLQSLLDTYHQTQEMDQEAFSRVDKQFHEKIVQSSENEYVKMMMKQINFNVNRYRLLSFRAAKDMEESVNQHIRLLEYLDSKDKHRFLEELQKHIRWSWEVLCQNLNKRII